VLVVQTLFRNLLRQLRIQLLQLLQLLDHRVIELVLNVGGQLLGSQLSLDFFNLEVVQKLGFQTKSETTDVLHNQSFQR
jgi:hypothetical protein